MFCPGGKNADGGRASSDENKLDFQDHDQEVQQRYLLVYRDDTKLCPKSVQRCEQCRLAFSSPPDSCRKNGRYPRKNRKVGRKEKI